MAIMFSKPMPSEVRETVVGLYSLDAEQRHAAVRAMLRNPAILEIIWEAPKVLSRFLKLPPDDAESAALRSELGGIAQARDQIRELQWDPNLRVRVAARYVCQLAVTWESIASGSLAAPPITPFLLKARADSLLMLQLHYALKWLGTWRLAKALGVTAGFAIERLRSKYSKRG